MLPRPRPQGCCQCDCPVQPGWPQTLKADRWRWIIIGDRDRLLLVAPGFHCTPSTHTGNVNHNRLCRIEGTIIQTPDQGAGVGSVGRNRQVGGTDAVVTAIVCAAA